MRKIPSTMATQHPDNACRPYWHDKAYITAADELEECYRCFSELGIEEYNWDWEGKFVDEAVVDRLYHKYADFFQNHPLGKEYFLTFRIANPRVEKQHRLARAFMVILTAAHIANEFKFHTPPLFEIILPLTETAGELMDIKEAFHELVGMKHKYLSMNGYLHDIEMIPLFEQVEKMMDSHNVLEQFVLLQKEKFGTKPTYLRPYCARSDPALNSGLVPTILAIKVALSSYLDFEKTYKIKLFPMIGTGSLPFRGGITPETIEDFLSEYKGMKTAIIQSAFRYDYDIEDVKSAIKKLNTSLPTLTQDHIDTREIRLIKEAIPLFTRSYRDVVESVGTIVNNIAHFVPKRRERHLHVGLFGYSRGFGKIRLPRAITFTACLYSLGIPPELIGTGRGLYLSEQSGLLKTVEHHYIGMVKELERAGRFLNKENLKQLTLQNDIFKLIEMDVQYIEKYLGKKLEPQTDDEKKHCEITGKVYEQYKNGESVQDLQDLIEESGVLRRSLG